MSEYISIKNSVLSQLEKILPEIQERFGIETIGIFGSVAREDDVENSDVDIVYTFKEGRGNLKDYCGAIDYIEQTLGRTIDFVSLEWMNPNLKPYVEPEIIMIKSGLASV